MSHRVIALAIIAGAFTAALGLGLAYSAFTPGFPEWHGMFCGVANAVTDGCDAPPRTPGGYWVTLAEYVVAVPLFGASFAFFTSALSAVHIRGSEGRMRQQLADSEDRLKQHVEDRLQHHLGAGDDR